MDLFAGGPEKGLFYERQSPFDFASTLDHLLKEVEGKSWNLSHTYDLQNTLKKHGKEVLPVTIVSICHPDHSSRILALDDERMVSSLMPCRISVYEKHDGFTYVSWMNSSMVASQLGGIVEQVMTESTQEVADIVEKVLRV